MGKTSSRIKKSILNFRENNLIDIFSGHISENKYIKMDDQTIFCMVQICIQGFLKTRCMCAACFSSLRTDQRAEHSDQSFATFELIEWSSRWSMGQKIHKNADWIYHPDQNLIINVFQDFWYTRISGRYAPLILAPAEISSLEPCTLDYLILII